MMTHRPFAPRLQSLSLYLAVFACLWVAAAAPAQAATTAASSAYGESITLNLLPLLGGGVSIDSGPTPSIAGSAPPAYSVQTSLADIAVDGSAGIGALLTTGVLKVEADSSEPAADQVHGRAEVDNAQLAVTGLLGLTANTIVSDSSITGTCGSSLTTTGTTQIVGAGLSGLAALGLTVPPNPAPNTQLLDVLGIRVVLNEQIVSSDGVNTASLTVNAVHVYLTNSVLSLIGALSGDVVIAQSQASISCGSRPVLEAALAITGTVAPSPGTVGQLLTYTLHVTDGGPDTATGVSFLDQLPAGVTFVSSSTSQGVCSGTSAISCNLGTLAVGSEATITLVVMPQEPGTLVDQGSVSSAVTNQLPAGASNTWTTVVNAASSSGGSADLSLSGSAAPVPAIAGDVLTYTLVASNAGPDGVTAATVTNTLPAGVSFLAAHPSQGTCAGTTYLVCSIGALASGANATITITALPTQAGTVVDTAKISSGTPDPNGANNTLELTTTVTAAPNAPCVPSSTILCIDDEPGDRRFQVAVHYATTEGGGLTGAGQAVPLESLGFDRGGIFWFFNVINPEMLIKVLNACALNQEFWVFYSAGTNVGMATTVTDTQTGKFRIYSNPDLTAAPPIEDSSAFACTATDLAPGAARAGSSKHPAAAASRTAAAAPSAATCTNDATSLCIGGRFQVTVAYNTTQGGGQSGMGQATQLTSVGVDRGGIFWFFDQTNPEMLIKVLDACSLEQTYWVFYSATTNVGLTVTVVDTVTGNSKVYTNNDLTAAPPVQDTSALPCD